MASPPITDRTYAYFAVTGKGSCAPISEALGLECTNSWSEGDIRSRDGRPYKHMRWSLESGLDDTHSIDEHIKKLLSVLTPLKQKLASLSESYELTLQCVGYFHPSGHGIHFSQPTVEQIASLSLCIDADFYYVSDNGHDLDYH